MQKVPEALGPYRIAVPFGNLLFVSGQVGIDPATLKFQGESVQVQARQALENLKAVLEEHRSSLGKVLKTTIFLVQMSDFEMVNQVYAEYFKENYPARSTVAVNALPKGARIEIEAIASL